ncbi:MAG: TolC family protein [Pseudomonadales bacterium]
MIEHKTLIRFLLIGALLSLCPSGFTQTLSLEHAESLALEKDPGYQGLMKQSRALEDDAIAESQLPDPMLMVGWLNVPVADFALDEEPMNQLRVGLKQNFPVGDTLNLKRKSALADASRVRQQSVTRRLMVLQNTRNAWIEVWYGEASLKIVRENEPMFEQLRDVTASLYRTGRKGLDDLVRSELELQRLKDREVRITENVGRQRAFLGRWIGSEESRLLLPEKLPVWETHFADRMADSSQIVAHPLVRAMDERIAKLQQGVELAREQYKPAWSLELGYAFRNAQRPNGAEVSDLASLSASVSLPVFTAKRQDKRLSSANRQANAGLDQRLDLLYELKSRLEAELVTLDRLNERIELYDSMILPQTQEQAQVALLSYKADRSDFTEVMRSHVAQLESTLELERLQADRLKSIAAIKYFLPRGEDLDRVSAELPGESK